MSNLPDDTILVDDNKRVIRPWLGFFRSLEASSNLSSGDITTLKTFIAAAEQILAAPEPFPELEEFVPYAVDVQTFTASGTWIKPSFGSIAHIRMWGPGGSGASLPASGNVSGGGGGVFTESWVLLSEMGDTETYTAGIPGAGVSGDSPGNDGTASAFGSWLTAEGGGGGNRASSGNNANGGFGAGVTPGSTGMEATPGSTNFQNAGFRGGGAPGGGVSSGNVPRIGGGAFNGGAGGGAASSSGDTAGGTSVEGGDGGAGNGGGDGVPGSLRGGGGGASRNGTSGPGGAPYCEVTVF